MSGYGRGEAQNGDIAVVVELKATNNRFREVQIRLPKFYLALESRIKKHLANHIQRGRVDVYVRRERAGSGRRVEVNLELAEQIYRAMSAVAQHLQRPPTDIPIQELLQQPGVLEFVEEQPDALGEWSLVLTALESALGDLCSMRTQEGASLQGLIIAQLDRLDILQRDLDRNLESLNEHLHNRLCARINRLVGDSTNPDRIAQEAAVLIDKSDISEELIRLRSHSLQLRQASTVQEPIGRKLDFILQEMNRDINTIGSKANAHQSSGLVVELKSTLEKLREHVASVE